MSWKNWPSWLKGGLISGGAITLIAFFMDLFYRNTLNWYHISFIPSWPVLYISGLTGLNKIFIPNSFYYALFILGLYALLFISWFIIGIIIGYIYGKIKSKKQNLKNAN